MELIRCFHEKKADIRFQDGGLPHVIGVCNYQVLRASRDREYAPEGRGFTYNHAPMLAYWQGYFLYEYLAGPKGEHETPSAVYLCKSGDGIHWEQPVEIFPPCDIGILPYRGPGKELVSGDRIGLVAHHRMGFYTTSQNRLLVSTFYGICPSPHIKPNNGYGVGRVVREIYADFTMSDIYFLRYNTQGGYNRENVDLFRPCEECPDDGFVEACRELLEDRAATWQWWEEERLDRDFFPCAGGAALAYYTLPDHAQYIRGITEANRRPQDTGMWIAYSVNKEDMWIARVPVPVRTQWKGPVCDDMDRMEEEELRNIWNLYVPSWGGAGLEEQKGKRRLHLWDEDLYNRTRAERVFEESGRVEIRLSLTVEHVYRDRIMLGVESGDGRRLFTLVWKADGEAAVRTGGRDRRLGGYTPGLESDYAITIDCRECTYEVVMTQGNREYREGGALGAAADSAGRLVIATKYDLPFQGPEVNGRDGDIGDLPGADRPVERNSVYISRLEAQISVVCSSLDFGDQKR